MVIQPINHSYMFLQVISS